MFVLLLYTQVVNVIINEWGGRSPSVPPTREAVYNLGRDLKRTILLRTAQTQIRLKLRQVTKTK